MSLTYNLLLKLSGGNAAVVERLTKDEREALWVDTPVAQFLREEAAASAPRHLFLSGSAGDGKTTLMQMTQHAFDPDRWHLELDASARDVPELVTVLTDALAAGRRLFVAINRGQLERLLDELLAEPASPLLEVVEAVAAGLQLRVKWTEVDTQRLADVVTIDLSLQDSLAPALVGSLLDKACGVQPPTSPAARAALEASVETLSRPGTRERIYGALRAVQLNGHHVTMRDLWGFVSHLLTGGLADPPQRSVTARDHVGCRLFTVPEGVGEVPVVDLVARYSDPARAAWPSVTRQLLLGAQLVRHPVGGASDAQGEHLSAADTVRALWIDGDERLTAWRPEVNGSTFSKILDAVSRQDGEWLRSSSISWAIIDWLATLAGDPLVGERKLPAWRRLAYEDRFRELAPAVASEVVDVEALQLGAPRPPPAARRALGDRAVVKFIWLADPASSAGARLRLTPWLLAAVDAQQRAGGYRTIDPRAPELIGLRHWLARLPTKPLDDGEVLVLDQRGTRLKIGRDDPFAERPSVRVEVKGEDR